MDTPPLQTQPASRPGTSAALLAEAYEANAPIHLGTVAYENYHAQVFHAWLNLDRDRRRDALRDRYVFLSVSLSAGTHLANLLKLELARANEFAAELLEALHDLAQRPAGFVEEWFRGLEELAGSLTDRNYLPEARSVVALGFNTGVAKFPRIAQSMLLHAAYLDALVGRRDKAAKVALRLVRRPYLLPNRRDLPRLYQRLMYILSSSNHLAEYRLVLWKGVSLLYTDWALRDVFVGQIVKTYRGALRALLSWEVPIRYRLPVLLGEVARALAATPLLRWMRVHVPFRWLHLASLYVLDLVTVRRPLAFRGLSKGLFAGALASSRMRRMRRAAPRRVLVTRAMGGIGDLLTMTPGLRALAVKLPKAQIDFAIPRSFHSVFDGFPAVRLLDINEEEIDLSSYQRWINLTDCPAGRLESRQYPNVRRNRIEIFARAMGISRWRLRRTTGFLPAYTVSEEETQWAARYLKQASSAGLPLIGVQPFAADTYRNWPYMEQLVERLARTNLVLVFHHEELSGYAFPNVIKVLQPLRRSVALAAQCDKLVVLDSSFLHFSAALGVPTVAIIGAISGRLRTRDYPNVHLLAPKKSEFPCHPCWRHEHKPCHLTNGRESICFRSITTDHVIDALKEDGFRNPPPWDLLAD